jgi:enoyl-CoA hydratase/carnithine racemase
MADSTTASPMVRLDWPLPQVAKLTLDRGSEFNTLTFEMLGSLDAAIGEAEDGGARVAIVTGSGRTFCGGAHVKYFTEPGAPLIGNARALRDDYVRPIIDVFAKLHQKSFVSIAAINGFALGGGCELALNCDFRLMSTSARIGLTEVRLGALAAAGGVQLLSKIVGRAKALEIALLGDQWGADDAARIGIVHAAHAPESLDDAALALARRLLMCSPVSVAETRRAIYRCETASAAEADEIALDAMTAAASGKEWWEGMAAFTQKRTPDFAVNGKTDGKAGIA